MELGGHASMHAEPASVSRASMHPSHCASSAASCLPFLLWQGMDTYSNILYVKEEFAGLSALAHRCAAADKYRPETCCVIGNYYSLRQGNAQTCASWDLRSCLLRLSLMYTHCMLVCCPGLLLPHATLQGHARAGCAVLPPRVALESCLPICLDSHGT